MVKSDEFWSVAKYIVSIITPVFQVIRYGDGNAPNLGEIYECTDSMLGQMRTTAREEDPLYHSTKSTFNQLFNLDGTS